MTKILLLLIFFLLAMSLAGFYFAIRPSKFISQITPAEFHVPFQNVAFETADHILLKGWYVQSKHPTTKTIILLHGYPADKGDILPSRIFLREHFNLLFFDFRYFGESQGNYTTIGKNEILDLQAAIKFLKKRGIKEVGVWGFSLGGSVAIMTAAVDPAIKAVVSESAYANLYDMAYDYYRIPLLKYPLGELTRFWGIIFLHHDIKTISPVQAMKKISVPMFILHSEDDNVIGFQHGVLLAKAAEKNPKLQKHFVKKLRHGESSENYQKLVTDFFMKFL